MKSYLVASDIHLGHNKCPTSHVISSFKSQILTEENKTIQVLFIAGDLFDQLLDLNSKEVHLIIEFFNYLLSYCTINNIKLRVLEGTPSHDNSQSEILVKLNDIRDNKCDLIYHKHLDIEYIESINKYVLYIPDEWTNSHQELETQINQKLQQHHISQVDIAILHGQFKYQFAGKPYKGFHFEEDYFLSLVKGYIHIGHYHNYSTFDRIIANGSLERLAHGEENPKGYILVKDNVPIFIENTNAFTFKTINVTSSVTLDKLDKQILKYPKGSYIRLLMNKDHDFNVIFPELKLRYLDYHLKKQIKEYASESDTVAYILHDTDLDLSEKFVLENNIHQTLLDIVHSKYHLNSEENTKLVNYISVFKEIEENASSTN